jgi:NAD+ kinase
MLEVEVSINGICLPTYWADGLILSTAAGSTAYSLSAGGPIVMPGAKVLIITPIASHNLNIRPLVVPDTSIVKFKVHTRDGKAVFTADNRAVEIVGGAELTMGVAQFSLKRVRLNSSNFINALTEKLLWGEDIRNKR